MLTHSESLSKIAPALARVAATIENPHKNATNPHFRNRYADLAEIINTSRDVLAAEQLTVIQCPGMDGDKVTVASMILHSSGEWIQGVSSSPIPKADPQGVGSATTYLRRYSLAALLGLAQEDDDGEGAGQGKAPAKTERVQDLVGEPPQGHVSGQERERRASTNGNGFSLESLVPVGKHKGKTWMDLIRRDPQYVEWAIDNMTRLDGGAKAVLSAALYDKPGVAAAALSAPLPAPGPDDGLPF